MGLLLLVLLGFFFFSWADADDGVRGQQPSLSKFFLGERAGFGPSVAGFAWENRRTASQSESGTYSYAGQREVKCTSTTCG